MTTLFKPTTAEYARLLQGAGFTVYAPNPDTNHSALGFPQGWFHYSRELNGGIVYGTAHVENTYGRSSVFYESCHIMPIKPSREFGSGVIVGLRSNGQDRPAEALSVAAAEYTAQHQNTAELIPGRSFHNFKPWGIGSVYIDLSKIGSEQGQEVSA